MEVFKAYKFRLEPTSEQAQMLDQWVGNARFVWNKALAMNLHRLDNHWRIMRYAELCKLLTLWRQSEDYDFLRLSPIHTLQQKLKDLDRAFSDAFDKNQPNKRIPRMKKRGKSLDSVRFPDGKSMVIGGEHNTTKLPKLGETKFRRSRRIKGEIRNATVSRVAGLWYISVLALTEQECTSTATDAVGIDMGVTQFATISDGQTHRHIAPLNALRQSEAKLAKAQKRLRRMKKFSSNWRKQQQRVARIHTRIANQRRDYLHKHSTTISKSHAMVFVEDLKVRNMSKSAKGTVEEPGRNVKAKSGLNKSILDQGWGEFTEQLKYKLAWQGGQLWRVPPHNTSRECPACSHTDADNRKTQAHFECVDCGFVQNADVVGAMNILSRGLRAVMPVEVIA